MYILVRGHPPIPSIFPVLIISTDFPIKGGPLSVPSPLPTLSCHWRSNSICQRSAQTELDFKTSATSVKLRWIMWKHDLVYSGSKTCYIVLKIFSQWILNNLWFKELCMVVHKRFGIWYIYTNWNRRLVVCSQMQKLNNIKRLIAEVSASLSRGPTPQKPISRVRIQIVGQEGSFQKHSRCKTFLCVHIIENLLIRITFFSYKFFE